MLNIMSSFVFFLFFFPAAHLKSKKHHHHVRKKRKYDLAADQSQVSGALPAAASEGLSKDCCATVAPSQESSQDPRTAHEEVPVTF